MERTVRYNNQVWNIDVTNNELYLPNNKKVRLNIDEIFDDLSDNDQNKIAEQFVEGNDITDDEMMEILTESYLKFSAQKELEDNQK